jgi:CBS domain-containing protein
MKHDATRIPTLRDTDVMTVGEAMHAGIITVPAEATLRQVAGVLSRERVHAVVVDTDRDDDTAGAFWGVLTSLDLVAAAVVGDLEKQSASASAATAVVTVAPGDSLTRAAQLMAENAVTHLVVVDPDSGRPQGILSTIDVARVLARDDG